MKAVALFKLSRFLRVMGLSALYLVLSLLLLGALSTPQNLSILLVLFFVMLSLLYFIEPSHFTVALIIFTMIRNNVIGILSKSLFNHHGVANIDAICLAFLFVLIVTGILIQGGSFQIGPKKLFIFMGLFMFMGIVSGLKQKVPPFILIHGFYFTFKGFLLYLTFLNMRISNYETYFRKLSYGILFLGLIVLIGVLPNLIYYKEMADILGFNLAIEEKRWLLPSVHSIFTHPHLFCFFVGFVMLLLFSLFLIKKDKWLLIGSVVSYLGIFLSMRRAELAAGLVSLFSVLFLRVERIKLKTKLILPILLIILMLPGIGFLEKQFSSGLDIQANPAKVGSVARVALYVGGISLANKYFPLGVGFGRFASVTAAKYYSPLYYETGLSKIRGLQATSQQKHEGFLTDTFYPHIIAETGWIGFFFFLIFILFVLLTSARIFSHVPENMPYIKSYCMAIFCYFIYITITSLISYTLEESLTQILSYGGLGVLVQYSLHQKGENLVSRASTPSQA